MISSSVTKTRLHTAHQAPELTAPGRQIHPARLRDLGECQNLPRGALGKLRSQLTGPGTQPRGSQNTGRLRYHHTRTSWAPVVLIQMKVENLKPKDDLADVRVVSGRQPCVPELPAGWSMRPWLAGCRGGLDQLRGLSLGPRAPLTIDGSF